MIVVLVLRVRCYRCEGSCGHCILAESIDYQCELLTQSLMKKYSMGVAEWVVIYTLLYEPQGWLGSNDRLIISVPTSRELSLDLGTFGVI